MEEIEKLRIFKETWEPFVFAVLRKAGYAETEDQVSSMMTLCDLMGPAEAALALCDPDWSIRDSIEARERESAHYRWMIANAAWRRHDGHTELVIEVEPGADLSCYATRDMAVRRVKYSAEGGALRPLKDAANPEAPNA